jgi:hypothetical protein
MWLFVPLLMAITCLDSAAASPGSKLLKVDRIDGYVELGLRGRDDRSDRPGAGTFLSESELKLDEILNLDISGSVIYPRLLRYDVGGELHFLQNLTNGNSFILPEGYVNLDFLEKKPYGMALFGRIAEDEIEGTFGTNVGARLESYGASLRYDLGPLPFRVRYAHRFYTREGPQTDPSADLDQVVDEVEFLGSYRLREGSDGDIRYIYADETLLGRPNQRHEFVADNVTFFDPEKRKRFLGSIRYFDWSGRSNTSDISVRGTYDWRHTDTFATDYHFDYSHRTFNEQDSDIYNLRASLYHELYGSLFSRATVFGNIQDATSGEINLYGFEIAESYRKQLGNWGQLRIGLAPRIRLQQSSPDAGTAFVLDENVIFFTDRAELRQFNIDTSSIVVTHAACLSGICQEGTDYLIDTPDDRRTVLERVPFPTGSIPSGETVQVDYEYRFGGTDNDVLQYGFNGNLGIDYRDWGTFFAEIAAKREDVVAGFTDRRLDNRDRQEFGFRTRGRWYSASVSFDWEDWDVRSSNGNIQTVSLSTPWPRRWRGSVAATHRGREFTNPSEKLQEWRVTATLDVKVGKRGLFELDPEYARENWSGSGDVDGRDLESIGARAAFVWQFRAIELRAEAAAFRIDRPGSERIHDQFFVRIRRYF